MHCCIADLEPFAQDQVAFAQDQVAFAQGLVAFVQDQEASFAQVLVAYQVLEYLDVKIVQVMEDLDFLLPPDFRLTQFRVWGYGA